MQIYTACKERELQSATRRWRWNGIYEDEVKKRMTGQQYRKVRHSNFCPAQPSSIVLHHVPSAGRFWHRNNQRPPGPSASMVVACSKGRLPCLSALSSHCFVAAHRAGLPIFSFLMLADMISTPNKRFSLHVDGADKQGA